MHGSGSLRIVSAGASAFSHRKLGSSRYGWFAASPCERFFPSGGRRGRRPSLRKRVEGSARVGMVRLFDRRRGRHWDGDSAR